MAYHNFVNKFILPCLGSIHNNLECETFVYVYDNESEHKDNHKAVTFCNDNDSFNYIRIDDQNKNGGLTAVWNQGIDLCIQKKCDIIFIINDDILVNETWKYFISSVVDDHTIYGPVTNNPGHAWKNKKGEKIQHTKNHYSKDKRLVDVGFVNGFCFGCTAKTFVDNMFDDKHYFDPDFPFGGNETEFQLRLFNLVPTKNSKQNTRMLDSLNAHNGAIIVPECYVYHYKNNAWRIRGGGKHSKEQFK